MKKASLRLESGLIGSARFSARTKPAGRGLWNRLLKDRIPPKNTHKKYIIVRSAPAIDAEVPTQFPARTGEKNRATTSSQSSASHAPRSLHLDPRHAPRATPAPLAPYKRRRSVLIRKRARYVGPFVSRTISPNQSLSV
jgi:hypothetical protein